MLNPLRAVLQREGLLEPLDDRVPVDGQPRDHVHVPADGGVRFPTVAHLEFGQLDALGCYDATSPLGAEGLARDPFTEDADGKA
eukprot:4840600-Pyramimonas_sp.AAC.1